MVTDGKYCLFSKYHCKLIVYIVHHSSKFVVKFLVTKETSCGKGRIKYANIAFNEKEVNLFSNSVTKLTE